MTHIREIKLADVIPKLPDIEPLIIDNVFSEKNDFFFCALGFEDRCLYIPELLAIKKRKIFKKGFYFVYNTNKSDNIVNKPKLQNALNQFCSSVSRPIECDKDDFTTILREKMNEITKNGNIPSITFDISTWTSKLLLLGLKVIFEFDVKLKIFYSEANVYYPTYEEYSLNPEKWNKENSLGLTKGVTKVIPSSEYHGYRRDRLPDVLVSFATFKPERTMAIMADIDESLSIKPNDRIIWIIGKPHLEEDNWRMKFVKEINKISDSSTFFNVCTFDYKETIKVLQKIYEKDEKDEKECHINISPLGSKMQSLGISLFYFIRPDFSVYFAMPKKYNAHQYSDGIKEIWQIDLGNLREIMELLSSIGQIEIVN